MFPCCHGGILLFFCFVSITLTGCAGMCRKPVIPDTSNPIYDASIALVRYDGALRECAGNRLSGG